MIVISLPLITKDMRLKQNFKMIYVDLFCGNGLNRIEIKAKEY